MSVIEIKVNGKPFNPKNLEEQLVLAAAEQVREKLGSIRHPMTGEFPTIAVTGTSLSDLRIQLEGSPELVALAQQRLAGETSHDTTSGEFGQVEPLTGGQNPPKVFLSFAFEEEQFPYEENERPDI